MANDTASRVVEVGELSFTYAAAASPAVRNLSLSIGRGEIFGLLGPSGAGKSTTQNWEYLVSKTVTLTALSLVEQVLIVWSAYGSHFHVGALISGIALAGVLYTLTGFILVARDDSINEYLFPSVLYVAVLSLPVLYYFELWSTWLLYLHPFAAPLVLLKAAFGASAPWKWAYGGAYAMAWSALLLRVGQRVFTRFIVARVGSH
jgi:fluoroquinolone transport system permease protein